MVYLTQNGVGNDSEFWVRCWIVVASSRSVNKGLKQWRRRRWGQRLVKNAFIIYLRISQLSKSIQCITSCSRRCKDSIQFQKEIRKFGRRGPRSSKYSELSHFTSVVLKRTAKRWKPTFNARAELLFCSQNLLFIGVVVAVVVVVCLRSLILIKTSNKFNQSKTLTTFKQNAE